MAIIYVDDTKTGGTNSGADWTNAYLSLISAVPTAGDFVYVAYTHNESQSGAQQLTKTGTGGNENQIVYISVDPADDSYTQGAAFTQTTSGSLDIELGDQSGHFIGIDLTWYQNLTGDQDMHLYFYDCTLATTSTGSGSGNALGAQSNGRNTYVGVTHSHTNAGHGMSGTGSGGIQTFINCTLAGTTLTSLFESCGDGTIINIIDCDFSAITQIVSDADGNVNQGMARIFAYRSKLPSLITDNTFNDYSFCTAYGAGDSVDHHGVHLEGAYGTTDDVTDIYRSATYDGTNEYSLKTVTTADGAPNLVGHKIHLCDVWCDANPTITVQLNEDNATDLQNDEVWIEVQQPDTTGPLGAVNDSKPAGYTQATSAALTTSTETWTGTGGWTNENKQEIAITVTGGTAGVHSVWVVFAPGSARTIYVDPEVDVT